MKEKNGQEIREWQQNAAKYYAAKYYAELEELKKVKLLNNKGE